MQPLIMPNANILQDIKIEFDSKLLWQPLFQIGGAVVRHVTSHSNEELKDDALAVMFEKSTWKEAQILADVITSETPNVQCVYFCIDKQTLQKTFHDLNKMKTRFGVVLVALNNETLMEDIFNHVMSNNAFHWTALVHVTEWLIITSRRIDRLTKPTSPMPDFVTTISFSDRHRNSISVYQKSRTEGLLEVFNFNLGRLQFESYFNFSIRNQYWIQHYSSEFHEKFSNLDLDVSDIKRMPTVSPKITDDISSRVRKRGKSYLRSKRSILDGVHLKVSLFVYPDGQDKMVEERKVDNRTVVDGFYVSMLQILQQGLGFTCEVILVNDSGYFGTVDADGQATGVVGHLTRREAAFTIIPLTMTLDRLKVIDFVSVCPVSEYTKVIYRLPEPGSTIDLSYVNIIQSDLVLIFLTGPLLTMALIGAFLHVMSRSCTLAEPQSCSIEALK
nr:putative glutamate receptor [Biomphalaria glabrata]